MSVLPRPATHRRVARVPGNGPAVDLSDVHELLGRQAGVVSRQQLMGAGGRKSDLDRMVRRRELARVHPGVYVDHTGPLTWEQRAWAAVLYAAPAALHLESALGGDPEAPIDIAIDDNRRICAPQGVRVHRVRDLAPQVLWNMSPPRVRVDDVVLELAHRAGSDLDVIRILTQAIGRRGTTAARLRTALADRARMCRRRWIERVLDDLATGACSVLEHRYLTHVERAHGLPRSDRQRQRSLPSGSEYRDVEYDEFGLVVELDGRAAHDSWDALGRDADRDLDDQANGKEAVRLRFPQVFGRPCRTANRLERILRRRGWTGRARACGPTCRLRTA